MKRTLQLAAAFALLLAIHSTARAQGTAFTYQGRLNTGGLPANGGYDFRFRLATDALADSYVGGDFYTTNTPVTNGLFITAIDFGPGIFAGSNYWLEVDVRTNNPPNILDYTALIPLQNLTPVPYAIFANSASNLSGTLPVAQLSGTVPLAQLPATVVTNNDTSVTLSNMTVSGTLTLPATTTTVFAGANSLLYQDGSQNFSAGLNAGTPHTPGSYVSANTAIGEQALAENAGGYNTAVGFQALEQNYSGYGNGANNTAIGYLTLGNNIYNGGPSGNQNTAEGAQALGSNSGSDNTANGYLALEANFGGNGNTASGADALEDNRGGSYNTADGYYALYCGSDATPIGSYNTADGYYALYGITTGSNNIALGAGAGCNLTSGSDNIDIGNPGVTGDTNLIRIGSSQAQAYIAGVINGNGAGLTNLNAGQLTGGTLPLAQLPAAVVTTSSQSVTFGSLTLNGAPSFLNPATIYSGLYSLLYSDTNGNFSAGLSAGNPTFTLTGSDNTALGNQALALNSSGNYNTALGNHALYYNQSGSANTAIGYQALQSSVFATGGGDNTSIGYQSLYSDTAGKENTAVGSGALESSTNDSELVALGYQALQNDNAANQGTTSGFGENMAVGYEALQSNTTGNDNIALGYKALQANTSGSGNVANGDAALQLGNGSGNTAIGDYALDLSGGNNNTAIGNSALIAGFGNNNIAVGYEAGDGLANYESDNIDIGNTGSSGDSGIIRIGTPGTQTATYLAGTVYANGVQLTSDRNVKENFTAINAREVLAKVAALPMTEWNYKTDSKDVQHLGPMAQDFKAAFNLDGADDKHISVIDEGGVALAAIQGLNQKLEEKDAKISELEKRLDDLQQMVQSLAVKK